MKFGDLRPGDIMCYRSQNDLDRFIEVHMVISVCVSDYQPGDPDNSSSVKLPKTLRDYLLLQMWSNVANDGRYTWEYSWFNERDIDTDRILVIR